MLVDRHNCSPLFHLPVLQVLLVLPVLLLLAVPAHAINVSVIGLTTGKAVLVIDGTKPRTVSVGQTTLGGVKLISADTNSAVVEIMGQRQTLLMGQSLSLAPPAGTGTITLFADSGGHFYATATINDKGPTRFLVDTGASMVTMNEDDAKRVGINFLKGEPVVIVTANGPANAYRVKLDSIRIGNIALNNVDAIVAESGKLHIGLLGMSFLNRVSMKRDGDSMTLTKRY